MNTAAPPYRHTNDELKVLAALLKRPPWKLHGDADREDRGTRAAFRRWSPTTGEPSYSLTAPIWLRLNEIEEHRARQDWDSLVPATWTENDREEVVRRAATLLHLVALQPDDGRPVDNFGAACRAAGVSNGRFARLVNPPPDVARRVEALSRAFRRFRQQGVHLRLFAEAEKQKERLAELWAFHTFLFTDDPARAVSRWAQGYFWQLKATPESTPAEA